MVIDMLILILSIVIVFSVAVVGINIRFCIGDRLWRITAPPLMEQGKDYLMRIRKYQFREMSAKKVKQMCDRGELE